MEQQPLQQPGLMNPQAYEINYPDIEEIQALYGQELINTAAGQRGNFFSTDPGGIFGIRQGLIEDAAKNYKPGQGFELGFNEKATGITQQDVANYYMTQYNRSRSLDPVVKEAKKLFPKGQRPNASTPQLELEKNVNRIRTGRRLTSSIKALDGGPARLAQAIKRKGGSLDNSELESLLSVSTNNTRDAVSTRDAAGAQIKNLEQATKSAIATDGINKDNLDLNRIIAQNNKITAENASATDAYRYEDAKSTAALDREFLASRDDAKFNAQLETVRLQNASEMERYEMMLENDRQSDRGDALSELMSALTVLGGSFAL